jgi:hypothetical protein
VENSGCRDRNAENLTLYRHSRGYISAVSRCIVLVFCVATAYLSALAPREKDSVQYGAGLIVNVPFLEGEVSQVVQETVQNGIIRGTKEYSKDEYISGAEAASSTRVFPTWTDGGRVFYKVRMNALDPQNFKNSGDVGTLAVRYVVQAQDEKHTVLRIDARFVEDFRHATHPSNGSVEGAEYKAIHDRLESIALMKTETAESEKAKLGFSSSKPNAPEAQVVLKSEPSAPPVSPAANTETIQSPPQPAATPDIPSEASLDERVHDLRKQVERIVKKPGAPLKAAPFHTASTLQALPAGAEVLIVISTPYWYGVETHEGQHGWILRDELETLP